MTNEEFRKQINIRTDDLISQIQRNNQTVANVVKSAYERGYADGKRNPNATTVDDTEAKIKLAEEVGHEIANDLEFAYDNGYDDGYVRGYKDGSKERPKVEGKCDSNAPTMTFGDIREVISQTELITLENEKFEQIKSTDLCMNLLSYWNKFEVLAVYIHKQYKSLVLILNTKGGNGQ